MFVNLVPRNVKRKDPGNEISRMLANVPHAGPFVRVPVTMFVFGLKYACLEKSHDKLTLMSKATLKKKVF